MIDFFTIILTSPQISTGLLALFSGFLGALFIKVLELFIDYIRRPKLKFVGIKKTGGGSNYYYSILIKNCGRTPARECIGKLLFVIDGKTEICQVPWGISLNPDTCIIHPRDIQRLDLFFLKKDQQISWIPMAIGKESSFNSGLYKQAVSLIPGSYPIQVKVYAENCSLSIKLKDVTLPQDIIARP